MQTIDPRRIRNDTFDLRGQIQPDDDMEIEAHAEAANYTGTDDEEHSVLEDDSDGEDREDYIDEVDDGSSSLSIPNESIDFDLVYSLHSFAATVEGQANVVKGDSLFLMDDSNSYWWLVRVLKTQEVGYIPAENIETPFERLARLNKHRNVDLASATQVELQGSIASLGNNGNPRSRSVKLVASLHVHKYPPAVWHSEDEDEGEDVEWDVESYEGEDALLAAEEEEARIAEEKERQGPKGMNMEPDDGMRWDEAAVEEMRAKQGPIVQKAPDVVVQQPQQQPQQARQAAQIQDQRLAALAQQQQQQHPPQVLSPEPQLRSSTSRERLAQPPDSPTSSNSGHRRDPLEQRDTVRMTMTPSIVREPESKQDEGKRVREEDSEDSLRKRSKGKEPPQKMAPAVSSASYAKSASSSSGSSKLRKERSDTDGDEGKKKKSSVFGGLFRKKDKDKKEKNGSISSLDVSDAGRPSGTSTDDGGTDSQTVSPTTQVAMQQQQQQQASALRNSMDPRRINQQTPPQTPPGKSSPPEVSEHASHLRQKDQQQQALYQQYLNRSPSSPPELRPNYGFQSASALANSYSSSSSGLGPPAQRTRPGSLILNQGIQVDGHIPELSVIRVFAGKNLQTDATFKTVLLASSTTSSELVNQALQRFRLPAADDSNDYYLTVKQIEGSSAILHDTEKPLQVFENLVEAAMEVPKVKRSSVGSISSVSSNLSMHPAIKKLAMNDFSDDSAVKFYLNRRGGGDDDGDDSGPGFEGEDTLIATDTSFTDSEMGLLSPGSPRNLTVGTQGNVPPERFSSPSFRFAMQIIIYSEDLPEDMVFDTLTEAIVFKHTLRDRQNQFNASQLHSPGLPMNLRRKVFVFPKNVTVAEVIEIGLERFGILEGVVDGGDEVEDKLAKRRSSSRVRYWLTVESGTQEKELSPSSKVIDAYARPPTFKAVDRRFQDSRRRSVDSAQLLGTIDDVSSDDPIFVLRRATSYRNPTSRHRMSAPLDELALRNLHRDSQSSNASSEPMSPRTIESMQRKQQPSQKDIIAAQRQARANEQAMLSTQTNSVRGVDVLLPGNARLRSQRYDADDRMRYSYVLPDGMTYDISEIVEEEWRDGSNKHDLLQGVIGRGEAKANEKLDRVLNKIQVGQAQAQALQQLRADSVSSQYSYDNTTVDTHTTVRSRSVTPVSGSGMRPGTVTPTNINIPNNRRNPSVASIMSDGSGYVTAASHGVTSPVDRSPTARSTPTPTLTPSVPPPTSTALQQQKLPPSTKRPPIHTKEDFGVSHMLAVIEYRAMKPKSLITPSGRSNKDVLDPVDELLFGRPIDIDELHPKVREVYADSFKRMAEMDEMLDDYLQRGAAGRS
ncbi:hypothetical protein BDP27DRAFT_1358958 [Rhodocollybia butyracea]|uniref:SH3 domain-containing protein n=1 Tax=Rhodocollybia butyracea TaxID=206335 RepID=A0A9P5PZ32_9AGAR|nr:hypothetical protein BDP27DRAFT_1358958 [Rhodocollybia butyracea]